MPTYVYRCACGAVREEYRTIAERDNGPQCGKCGGSMAKVIVPTMVAVFQPYRSVAAEKDGGECPFIRNRKEHEAFLRRNGYEEVGNDKRFAPPTSEEIAERREAWKDAPDAPMVDVEKLKREGFVQEDLTV